MIVGGTNGKGTTASFLAHLLKLAGHRVGLYTSPHLHSIRERIQIDGQSVEKEIWSEGMTHLQHVSFTFEEAGFGAFTKFEALTALAALQFKRHNATFGVFEVGLGGRYDATNAWDSELAVLTSVDMDHTEVLGDTVEAIARDKLQITRSGAPLYTPSNHSDAVRAEIACVCKARDVPVVWIDPDPELLETEAAPVWLIRNQSLALSVAELLDPNVRDVMRDALDTHSWPGRCEVGSRSPLVILDGAHNPAAAEALVEHLRSKGERWRFILGASQGHRASELIAALAPIAAEFILTESDHPRASEPQMLADLVPTQIPSCVLPGGADALKEALSTSEMPICVTGSLHIVAKAREALGLVEDREGISEDVLLESLQCLELAVDGLGLTLHAASDDGNVVRVDGSERSLYFLRNKHPFNDYVTAKLAEDKAYQYELFLNAGLRVPYTMKLFNPYADERFSRYLEHATVDGLIAAIESQMSYPLVVKRNQGSFAQGVYLEHDRAGLSDRLDLLFRHSGYLNNILICQSFVAGREYRAVASGKQVLLVYEKQGPLTAEAGGDMNPLHRPGGLAVKVEDPLLLKSFAKTAESIAEVMDLGFYAIDAIVGVDGLAVLEVNPNPVCYFYNDSNGRSDFVDIYAGLLRQYAMGSTSSRDVTLELGEE